MFWLSVTAITVASRHRRSGMAFTVRSGIAREADTDDHVILSHAENLFENLAGGIGIHQNHVIKDEIEVKTQKNRRARKRSARP
jgi:hypothetical protein